MIFNIVELQMENYKIYVCILIPPVKATLIFIEKTVKRRHSLLSPEMCTELFDTLSFFC